MSDIEFYKPLVANGPRRLDLPTEADYHAAWPEHTAGCSNLLEMAVTGGLIADRLAWVFLAGYQAACRHAFPGADIRSWVAFVASEGVDDLPGVTLEGDPVDGALSGYKTWVAAAATVEQLIVKVGGGSNASYFLVDRDTRGLEIEPGARASFLGDMSQGRARFEDVSLRNATRLDGAGVKLFGLLEPLYIYAAFCGFVLGATTERDLVICSHDCLDGIEPALASVGAEELDRQNVHKADARAQDLLVRLTGNRIAAAGDWDGDQRLIAMYSKGIRRRYG